MKKKVLTSIFAVILSLSLFSMPINAFSVEQPSSNEGQIIIESNDNRYYINISDCNEVSEEELPESIKQQAKIGVSSVSSTRAGSINLYNTGDSYSSSVDMSDSEVNLVTPTFNVSLDNHSGIRFYPTNIVGNNTISVTLYFKTILGTESQKETKWYNVIVRYSDFFFGTSASTVSEVYFQFNKAETNASSFDYTVSKVAK